MHLVINGWFWDQPHTGSGQYLHRLIEHLPLVAPDLRLTLAVARSAFHVPRPTFHFPLSTFHFQLSTFNIPPSNLGKVWFEQVIFPRACRALGADVALVPYWGSPLAPSVPTVVSILDLIPLLLPEYRGGPWVRLYTSLVAASALKAACVLTISESSRRDIIRHLHIPPDRVHVTYLAADERFTPQAHPAADAALRQHHPALPPEYVLYLGGFDARKNIETLLRMCHWLRKAFGQQFPLVMAGALPPRHDRFFRDPRVIARQLGVEEMIGCIGAVDEEDKPALYRNAAAFVFPSRYEGFGLPVLEALACGVPVVGSNAAALPEVVGDAGLLVEPDDAERMAGGLIAVLNDETLRRELTERAVKQAARFSWQRCAQQTIHLLRSTLHVPPSN